MNPEDNGPSEEKQQYALDMGLMASYVAHHHNGDYDRAASLLRGMDADHLRRLCRLMAREVSSQLWNYYGAEDEEQQIALVNDCLGDWTPVRLKTPTELVEGTL